MDFFNMRTVKPFDLYGRRSFPPTYCDIIRVGCIDLKR